MRFALGLFVLAILLALPARASAAGTARLVYLRGHATETCPDEQALRDAVAARLGYEAFTPWALDTLFAEIEKDGAAFVARVKLVTPENVVRGSRTIRTTGPCSDLVPTLGLTISLAIDPMALSRKGPPEGLPPTERPVESFETPPEAPAEKPAPAAPAPHEEEHAPVVIALGAGVLGAAGSAPAPAIGALVFARARVRDVSATLEARGDLPTSTTVESGAGASAWLLAGSALVCLHGRGVFGCPRVTVGRLSATGIDVTRPGASAALWADVGARVGYELELGGAFALRAALDGGVVLTRYVFRIDGERVFQNPAVTGGASAALVATFR